MPEEQHQKRAHDAKNDRDELKTAPALPDASLEAGQKPTELKVVRGDIDEPTPVPAPDAENNAQDTDSASSASETLHNTDTETDTAPESPHELTDEPVPDDIDLEQPDVAKPLASDEPVPSLLHKPQGKWHRFGQWFGTHKKLSIPLTIVLLLAIVGGVPQTRYAVLGLFWRQDYMLAISDSQTHQPISGAWISMAGLTAQTDNHGRTTLHAKVGPHTMTISKKYYKTQTNRVTVPIKTKKNSASSFTLSATGRQVPVMVVNRISGRPIANALIAAAGTDIKTDEKGMATIVLPTAKSTANAQLSATGYNATTATLHVISSVEKANTFQLTPSGKLYFLSNLSGKIDVVKTNLDGTERQTVLAGTGNEEKANTIMLASQDWKYLALLSKRDGGTYAKLFLINTSNDSVTTMDEGSADLVMIGWDGHDFVYNVNRPDKKNWEPNASALKAYSADGSKIIVLDQTIGGGNNDTNYFHEQYAGTYILGNEIVFAKSYAKYGGWGPNEVHASLNTIHADGSGKRTVKTWDGVENEGGYGGIFLNITPYDAGGLYVAAPTTDPDHLYKYEASQVTTVSGKKANDIYGTQYNTYLFAPSNK